MGGMGRGSGRVTFQRPVTIPVIASAHPPYPKKTFAACISSTLGSVKPKVNNINIILSPVMQITESLHKLVEAKISLLNRLSRPY